MLGDGVPGRISLLTYLHSPPVLWASARCVTWFAFRAPLCPRYIPILLCYRRGRMYGQFRTVQEGIAAPAAARAPRPCACLCCLWHAEYVSIHLALVSYGANSGMWRLAFRRKTCPVCNACGQGACSVAADVLLPRVSGWRSGAACFAVVGSMNKEGRVCAPARFYDACYAPRLPR